jgi:hypothetical protein
LSDVLCVTSVRLWTRAVAALNRSIEPTGRPWSSNAPLRTCSGARRLEPHRANDRGGARDQRDPMAEMLINRDALRAMDR